MDLYQLTFAVLDLGTGYVAFRHQKPESWPRGAPDEEGELRSKRLEAEASATRFKMIFITVYLLVMGLTGLKFVIHHSLQKSRPLTNAGSVHIYIV